MRHALSLHACSYDDALQHVVVNIGLALAGHDIERHKSDSESMGWGGALVLAAFLGGFGFLVFKGIQQNMRQSSRYKVRGSWEVAGLRVCSMQSVGSFKAATVMAARARAHLLPLVLLPAPA